MLHKKEEEHKRKKRKRKQKGGIIPLQQKKKKQVKKNKSQKGGILKYLQPWNLASERNEMSRNRKTNGQIIKDRHPEYYKNSQKKWRTIGFGTQYEWDHGWYKKPENKKFKAIHDYYKDIPWEME